MPPVTQIPKTRHSLLIRLANPEDKAAWLEFLEVYEVAVFRYACHCGLQAADAEDVTQKVLAAVLGKVKKWVPDETKGSFGAWLFRVTRNQAAKVWNDRKKNAIGTGDSIMIQKLANIPEHSEREQTVFQVEYRRALFHWAAERIRDQVQEQTWLAFWMTTVEEKTTGEAAENLGLSASSVYTAKCRILNRIRKEIDQFEVEFSFNSNQDTK